MKRPAFTLIELLVVIAIIGLLSTVAVVATSSSGKNARNAKRKADLVQMSKALELYYADHGAYPIVPAGGWYGNCAAYGSHPDVDVLNSSPSSCTDLAAPSWIPGLTSCGYMGKLPDDPRSNKTNPDAGHVTCRTDSTYNCYTYESNGASYALRAHCTPEGTWGSSDPFYDPIRPTWAWMLISN